MIFWLRTPHDFLLVLSSLPLLCLMKSHMFDEIPNNCWHYLPTKYRLAYRRNVASNSLLWYVSVEGVCSQDNMFVFILRNIFMDHYDDIHYSKIHTFVHWEPQGSVDGHCYCVKSMQWNIFFVGSKRLVRDV